MLAKEQNKVNFFFTLAYEALPANHIQKWPLKLSRKAKEKFEQN